MTPSPLPTVRAVWRLALPLGSELVAGALGLARPARWARVAGVLSPLFPTLHPDEVALLDWPTVQDSNPGLALARVVRELAKLGVAAIAVRGAVEGAARREAQRANLPLFRLPDDAEVGRAARAITRLVSDREAQEEAQAAALLRHLSQRVAAGEGLARLVAELHRLTGHAIEVTDAGGLLVAQAGRAPERSESWSHPLSVGDAPAAQLALRDSPDALDEWTRAALEQGAAALALEWVKREAVEAAREGAQGDFVATLLAGEGDTLLVARARAADIALDAAQWIVVAVADEGAEQGEALRGWLRQAAARAEALGWQPRPHLGETSVAERPVWQATLALAGGGAAWEPRHEAFLRAMPERWDGSGALTLAAGDPAPGLKGLRQALAQATDALALGLRLVGAGRCFLHRDMGPYRLLRHLQGTDDLRDFLDGTLAALEAYDRDHGSELVATVRTLLDQGGNLSAAAKALHLHRNSLAYRVERIRAIAGLDPTDPADAFSLRLALLLAPLR